MPGTVGEIGDGVGNQPLRDVICCDRAHREGLKDGRVTAE